MRIWPLLFLIFSTSLFAAEPTGQFATKNPYTILGVKPDTLYDEVKKIYRRMAMQHHPERYEGSDAAGRAASAENFKQISLAYAALESGNFDAFIFAGYTGCQFKSPRTGSGGQEVPCFGLDGGPMWATNGGLGLDQRSVDVRRPRSSTRLAEPMPPRLV